MLTVIKQIPKKDVAKFLNLPLVFKTTLLGLDASKGLEGFEDNSCLTLQLNIK